MYHLINSHSKADKLANDFIEQSKQIVSELKGVFDKKDSLVTLKTLRSLEFEKWYYNEDESVKFKLIRLTKDEAVFIGVINPIKQGQKTEFGLQRHDCIERGIVVEGHLIDDLNHIKALKNETWQYKIDQRHRPYAEVYSVYEVTFTEK